MMSDSVLQPGSFGLGCYFDKTLSFGELIITKTFTVNKGLVTNYGGGGGGGYTTGEGGGE